MQVDSTTNAVVLDSSNTTGIVRFVTDGGESSDFPGFALGYGLYYLNLEFPYEPCSEPPSYLWNRETWVVDLRDSRFANAYGVGEQGEMTFLITLKYQHKQCGPPDIDIRVSTPSRNEPLLLANHGMDADYAEDTPVPVHVIFEQAAPEFDFRVSGSIFRGLDSTLRQHMNRTFELTHSARLDADLEWESPDVFTVTNTFNAPNFTIVRDSVTVLLPDARSFSYSGQIAGVFNIIGKAGNPILFRSCSDTKPTGLILNGIMANIEFADLELVQPLAMISDSGSFYNGSLSLRNSIIRRTENQGDGNLVFILQPYAVRIVNSSCFIDSCTIVPAVSTVSRGSGILIKNAVAPTRVSDCTIEDFPGHGMEIVDGPELSESLIPQSKLWLKGNTIRDNRLYGVHIRGARAYPYFEGNTISANGWLGENEPAMQSRKLDGVNIQSANGIFQSNSFDSSGAYGLHAAYNVIIRTIWNSLTQLYGGNCFRSNYYNVGGSGNSWLVLGKDSTSGQNAFTSPRGTWSDQYHVTLRNTCIGDFKGNAWESPTLSATPYPIDTTDFATSSAQPEWGGDPILCTVELSPGGARNDSIINGVKIDAITSAVSNSDWLVARDLCIQLLNTSNDPCSATFATTTLIDALRELNDPTIPSILSSLARDTMKYHSLIAANYSAIKAFAYTMEYDSSLAMANFLAQRFPYSDHWRFASIMAAFVQNDYLGNYNAAEDILQSVLSRFPEDALAIGAYYSVKGMLPSDFAKQPEKEGTPSKDPEQASPFEIYPNPAKGEITVCFLLEEDAQVRISLYDNAGKYIAELTGSCTYLAGVHNESYSIDHLQPGYYHLTLRVNERGFHEIMKVVP